MSKTRTITKEEWLQTGFQRFGDDTYSWLFKCPICAHIQCFRDFEPYVDSGARPDDAFTMCIGRYQRATKSTLGPEQMQGCNYTSHGRINLAPLRVVGSYGTFSSFAFANKDSKHNG